MKVKEFDVDISTYEIKEVKGFDFEFGFKIRDETIDLPKNILSLQEKKVKFYYLSDTSDGFKSPYMLKKGDVDYWIGTDNLLYFVDEDKLVPGEFRGQQVKWKPDESKKYKKDSKKDSKKDVKK